MKKVYFVDLDGTLIDKNKKVSDFNMRMLAKAEQNGNKVVIVTGRGIDFVNSIGLGKYLSFVNNGAAVFENGKLLDVTPVGHGAVAKIHEAHPESVIEYAEDKIVALIVTLETQMKALDFIEYWENETDARFYPWKDGLKVEVTAKHINKVQAAQFIYENFPEYGKAKFISFGDEVNDIQLAENVHLSIAPCDVDELAAPSFDYIARNNSDENFVGLFIKLAENNPQKSIEGLVTTYRTLDRMTNEDKELNQTIAKHSS